MTCACGAPADRTLLAVSYCDACAEQILQPIRSRVLDNESGIGWGRPHTGQMRPDHAPGFADLACNLCHATWVGPIGEICPWCQEAVERQRTWQAELVLEPPDVDPDDIRRPAILAAWQQRLTVAITAGLISRHQAARAWDRA